MLTVLSWAREVLTFEDMSQEWFGKSSETIGSIHELTESILTSVATLHDEAACKKTIEEYVEQVTNLRNMLLEQVDRMSTWKAKGQFNVERSCLYDLQMRIERS